MILFNENRLDGLISSIPLKRSMTCAEASYFNWYLPAMISCCKSLIVGALKGTVPYIMANKTTPADHISTPKEYPVRGPLLLRISGAM